LIVEDNDMNMRLFSDLLKENGYTVVQSVDGHDTLELARKHLPGLVIMDIQLPEVSGLDRTRSLKADPDLKHIPVLAVTAFTLEGGLEKVWEVGCDDVMGKPISVPDFLQAVGRYF
jgi:two-component system cell cycle response regulator DivK